MKISKRKYHCSNFFLCWKLKSRVSFIQLKPILDILLHGFSLSSCPQHSLKVLLLLNPMCLLKYVLNCEHNFSFFMFRFRLTVTGLMRDCCIASDGRMSDVLKRISKVAVVTKLRYNPGIYLEGQRNTTISLTGIPAEIQTEHLSSTTLEHYH
jgi:hypothetical protein